MSRSSSSRMMVSASSGTTSQAIFSITSRLALDSASRSNASPPSAGGGTTLSEGLWAADGTGRSGVGVGEGAAASSRTSSSSGMSSSSSSAGAAGGGGREAAGGGCDGRGGGGGGLDAGTAAGLATGAPGTGGFAAGGGGLGAGGGAEAPGLATAGGGRGGFDVGVDRGEVAPAGMGGRAITIVLPDPVGTAEPAGLGGVGFEFRAGGAGGFWGGGGPAAMTGFAFGFARMVLTCSISFALSKGFGMWPFAPTAMALAGSMGAGPPSRSTGTSFSDASPRTRWQSS